MHDLNTIKTAVLEYYGLHDADFINEKDFEKFYKNHKKQITFYIHFPIIH